jgi:hypothetical protein
MMDMLRYFSIAVIMLAATNSPGQVVSQPVPHTEADTLSGKKIVLPDAIRGHLAIFIVGFSRAGGEACTRWDKALRQQFGSGSSVQIYNVAELQDAPKMVRGLIRRGMRKGVPADEQDFFVLLYQDEEVWKQFAGFSAADDAYILLLDSKTNIQWRAHGKSPDQQALIALRGEVAKISGKAS